MKGVIMAGGEGRRLRPLTLHRPKPMVEVLGRPVIDYSKHAMTRGGVNEIIVTTGYRGEILEAHVETWNADGVSAKVNREDVPMGTAGSVKLLQEQLDTTFIVASGDNVASFDIPSLLEAHRRSGAKVTMALWQVEDPTEFGIVGLSSSTDGELDGELEEGYIVRFLEKPKPEEAFSSVINAGLYIIEPEVLELVPTGEKYDFSKQLFPALMECGWPIYAKAAKGVWFDVGSPAELLRAQPILLDRSAELPFPQPEGKRDSSGGLISHSARVEGQVESTVILSNAVVAEGAYVTGSLLMHDSIIGRNAKLRGSIIGNGAKIGEGAKVEDCVIGDNERVAQGECLIGIKRPDDNSN